MQVPVSAVLRHSDHRDGGQEDPPALVQAYNSFNSLFFFHLDWDIPADRPVSYVHRSRNTDLPVQSFSGKYSEDSEEAHQDSRYKALCL